MRHVMPLIGTLLFRPACYNDDGGVFLFKGKTQKKEDFIMTVETKHVVATVAYMAGVPDHKLLQFYGEEHELLAALAEDRDATVVRYLSRFKTALLRNFKRVDEQIRYELASLNSISCS